MTVSAPIALPELNITFSVDAREDIFRAFAFLGLAAIEAFDRVEKGDLSVTGHINLNQNIGQALRQLWTIADQKGWDNIFIPHAISHNTLSPDTITGSSNSGGRGLLIPILRMAGNMIESDPALIWDTENPKMRIFVKGAISYIGSTGEQSEKMAEIILDRAEALRDQRVPKESQVMHEAASWSLAQILVESNLRRDHHRAGAGAAHEDFMLRSDQERHLYHRLDQKERIPVMIALLSVRLDQKNANWKWASAGGIEFAIRRATAAEQRALALLPSDTTNETRAAFAAAARNAHSK